VNQDRFVASPPASAKSRGSVARHCRKQQRHTNHHRRQMLVTARRAVRALTELWRAETSRIHSAAVGLLPLSGDCCYRADCLPFIVERAMSVLMGRIAAKSVDCNAASWHSCCCAYFARIHMSDMHFTFKCVANPGYGRRLEICTANNVKAALVRSL
jgi:hypothetical protein